LVRKFLIAAAVMAGVGVAGTGLLGVAQAQAPAQPNVVAIRQASMGLLGGTAAALRAGVEAKAEAKNFAGAGNAISNYGKVLASLFPQGSGANTKALPEIWTNWAGFEKAAADLTAAGELVKAAAAANDAGKLADAVKAVGDACGGCHRTFRAR